VPVFFQHQINEDTRLGIWKIEETEEFFKGNVPLHREVTHPHKRLQHLAGRFLLQYLFPDFPYQLIEIADTRKPFLPDEQYHFSISHCGDYAAAIVSKNKRVGIDIEIPAEKISRIMYKFLSAKEHGIFNLIPGADGNFPDITYQRPTVFWSAKEAVYKWYGNGGIDFRREIQLLKQHGGTETIDCFFSKDETELIIHYRQFEGLVLAWVMS
jgi:phosphopantetheinyl transferase